MAVAHLPGCQRWWGGQRDMGVISGVVVASRPECLEAVSHAVEAFEWADIHYSDPRGRLVVTVEAAGIDESIDRVETLQAIPQVLSAALAEFRLDGDES